LDDIKNSEITDTSATLFWDEHNNKCYYQNISQKGVKFGTEPLYTCTLESTVRGYWYTINEIMRTIYQRAMDFMEGVRKILNS